MHLFQLHGKTCIHSGKKKKYKKERKNTGCKMYGDLPWYYYFVTTLVTIIIIIIINLNILDINVFSPVGNQHLVNIYFFSYSHTSKQKSK